ncbi:MAG: S8 family serine peptidase, partial [Owenweeksia sp.]
MPGDVALSEQAISKRKMRGIALDFRDVPVNRAHMDQITSLGGTITARSRWFNYVVVKGVSRELLEAQPFVHKIEVPKTYEVNFAMTEAGEQTHTLNYGLAQGQIEMLRGQKLHEMGYQGQGMTIAVLDGGFIGTNNGAVFDSLWMNNRILGTYNFVDGDTNVFTDGSHGTKVLSILGGYLDNQIIGSAPKANYWLLKSEKESSETPVEMDYWLMAAEFADSVGADIISSSLGYNEFQSGFDYQYSDMDGNTTVVTKAADMAAQK